MSLFLEEQETEKRSTTDTSNADNSENDKRFVSSTVPGFVLLCLSHYLALHLEMSIADAVPQYISEKQVAWHEDISNRHRTTLLSTLKAFAVHNHEEVGNIASHLRICYDEARND